MADVIEKVESRERTATSERRIYIVTGTSDAAVAQAAMWAATPATADGFPRSSRSVTPAYIDDADESACVWEGEVMYQNSPDVKPLTVSEKRSQIQIGASGTLHITSVPSVQHSTDVAITGEDVVDTHGVLGFDGESVQGADVDSPSFRWSETHVLANATVTDAYVLGLIDVRFKGPLNESLFRGFQPEEVKLCGISGGAREDQDVELTFEFEARPNIDGVIYGECDAIDIKGWDNVTLEYRTVPNDGVGHRNIRAVCAVHLDKVYLKRDFGVLGIGTGGSPIFPGL